MKAARDWWYVGIGIVLAAAVTTAAFAHSGAKGVVKERMDAMSDMAKTLKALAPMMRGQAPYDAKAVRAGAAAIKAHAGEALTQLFPEGSTAHPSEARPVIWDDWAAFARLAQELEEQAEALMQVADNGVGATADGADVVFLAIGRNCSVCHGRFRVEDD